MRKPVANARSAAMLTTDRFFITALGIGQICSWGSLYYSFPQISAAMAVEFGWSRTEQYAPLTLGLILAGLLAYPVGRAIDRGYGRQILTFASLAAGILLLCWSQISSITGFYIISSMVGALFAATLYEPAFAVVSRRTGADRARSGITALTLWGGFASTVFIPLIELVMETHGWRATLWMLATVNLGLCAPLYAIAIRPCLDFRDGATETMTDTASTGASNAQGAAPARTYRRSVFWLVAMFFIAHAALTSAFTFHLYPLLSDRGFQSKDVVMIIAVIGPAQVAGRFALTLLAKNASISAIGAVTVGLVILVFAALSIVDTSLLAMLLLSATFGAANGVMTIVRGMAVPELLTSRLYGTINGLLVAPSSVAKALAPIGAAYLYDISRSYELVIIAFLVSALAMGIGFWGAVVLRRRREKWPANADRA